MAGVTVSMCLCRGVRFGDLLPRARAAGWDLESLMRETGCGELCDPADPADIARAIRTIIDAPADERLALRVRCLEVARTRYSWQRQAQELLRVYDELGV